MNREKKGRIFCKVVALKRAGLRELVHERVGRLTTETVEGTSLSLESIDHIHSSDSSSLSMFSVSDSIANHVLQKHLENTTSLFVNETRDTLHTTTASETADSGLGYTLDVISQDLPMALSASFSKTFASFATARHS